MKNTFASLLLCFFASLSNLYSQEECGLKPHQIMKNMKAQWPTDQQMKPFVSMSVLEF